MKQLRPHDRSAANQVLTRFSFQRRILFVGSNLFRGVKKVDARCNEHRAPHELTPTWEQHALQKVSPRTLSRGPGLEPWLDRPAF